MSGRAFTPGRSLFRKGIRLRGDETGARREASSFGRWTGAGFAVFAASVLFAALPQGVEAQDTGIIEGVVQGPDGQPLSGAQVEVVGTARRTLSGGDGTFQISGISAGERTVRATLLGFRAAEETVDLGPGEIVSVEFQLTEDVIDLDAIVAAGTAGLQERRAQGAQVGRIDASELMETAPIRNVSEVLQGREAGVSLTQSSGTVGTAQRIRIRGGASINLSNEPLIVIDGIRMDNRNNVNHFTGGQVMSRLNDLDPGEIESMEIVKGPAAASLYGADASAGVIRIETRSGQVAQDFSQTVGLEYRINESMWTPPANYGRCGAFFGEDAVAEDSFNPLCAGEEMGTVISDNPLERSNTLRAGTTTASYRLNWSGRGGGEDYGYFASFAGEQEDGLLPNNEVERFSARVNFDWTPTETVTLDARMGLNRNNFRLPDNDNNIYGFLGGALLGFPQTRGLDSDGWYAPNRDEEAIAALVNRSKVLRATPQVSLRHSPTGWFNHELTLGADFSRDETARYFPRNDQGWYATEQANSGDLSRSRDNREEFTADYRATANRQLTDDLGGTFSGGSQVVMRRNDIVWGSGYGFPSNVANSLSNAVESTSAQSFLEERELGFFTQGQLDWDNRIFLTGAVRWDFNSTFGDRAESFVNPSVEGSWVLSEEPFFEDRFVGSGLSSLRLRGAWGRSGRSPSPTAALRTFTTAPVAIEGGQAVDVGVAPDQVGNPELRPEIGEEWEAGLDAGFVNERIGLELTWFNRKSKDLLLSRPLAPSLGFGSDPLENIGELQNQGLEVGLDADIVRRPDVAWDLNVNVSTLDQEVTDLGDIDPFGGTTRVAPGLQPYTRFTHTIQEINVEEGHAIVSDTMQAVGNNTPTFEGNVASNITLFENLTLRAQGDWSTGFVIYNNTAQFRERQMGTGERFVLQDDPDVISEEEAIRRFGPWYDPEGNELDASQVNDAYIEDGDFFRIRELSLSYRLPDRLNAPIGAASTRLTLGVRNVALFTNYTGADPEMLSSNTNYTRTDFLTEPMPRVWSLSANVQF